MISRLVDLVLRPQAHSLKLQSIRAAIWSLLEKGSSQAIRMIGSLILTRILFPEAFGIMATAQIILVMVQLFTDMGVRTAIIQNPDGAKRDFMDTAWLICAFRGGVLSLFIAVLAWPLSVYFEQRDLMGILLILSLTPLVMGLENPALTVMIKQFRVEKKVALELGSQSLGLVSSIILAWLMGTVQSLAIGGVLTVLYRMAGSFMVAPYRPRFHVNKEYRRQIFDFGRFIVVNSFSSFLAMNADILITGKILHMKDLGIYSLGRNIGTLIWIIALQVFIQSYMPAVSSVQNDLPRVVRMYRRYTAVILALVIPASLVIALFARDIIGLLYDPRYLDASISMSWFCLSGILLVLSSINTNTILAMGRPRLETASMVTGLVLVLILVPMGAKSYGLTGAAAGMFVSVLAMVVMQTVNITLGLKFPAATAMRPLLQILLVSLPVALLFRVLKPLLSGMSMFNLPFILLMTFIALLASGAMYVMWEGTQPFRDHQGA